jgi:muramoyltetrapeptide carboxypeptidase
VIRPRRLRAGDRVALVAPASAFEPAELEAGIAELSRLGFEAVFDRAVLARERFEAGPPEVRVRVLEAAWRDPSIAALIAVRGGYGSQQLLPLLDPAVMRAGAKLLIGYSDITSLLCWSFANGVVSLHGPMVDDRLAAGPARYDQDTFVRAVTVPEPLGPLRPQGLEAFVGGEAWGPLVGGTLTQIVALLGTPWAFDVPRGAVLFLEDVGERPYRVHRMLTQLSQSGSLARAGAIVFGEFPRCDEPGGQPAIRDVLIDFVRGFPGPVLFGFPSGHTAGPSWTLPIGVRAHVASDPPTLSVDEAAVS